MNESSQARACPMCDAAESTPHRFVERKGMRFRIVRCAACRFVFVANPTEPTFRHGEADRIGHVLEHIVKDDGVRDAGRFWPQEPFIPHVESACPAKSRAAGAQLEADVAIAWVAREHLRKPAPARANLDDAPGALCGCAPLEYVVADALDLPVARPASLAAALSR